MYKALTTVMIAALAVAITPAPPTAAATTAPTPAPVRTPPPQIYHIVTRPLCAELHEHIAPTVGMMLENDKILKESPKLFSEYNRDSLNGVDNSASNSNGAQGGVLLNNSNTMNASQNMTVLKMENMVSPLANNIIAMRKLLDSPALVNGTGNVDDDKQLAAIRATLLKAIADQSASLDIVNGFVQTQQMGDLQHAGEEYIAAMNQPDTTNQPQSGIATPNPLLQSSNQAGLPPDPYAVDLANVPGLTLGYNPTTRLRDAVKWTIQQTANNENDASKDILASAAICSGQASPAP
ncbi:MAG TPA: hypothetical protein VMH02_08195 [Verrucomicrobiae bacterium]|nr:hypothetical protein [Verrucomicrobiae bacterium]